MAATRMGVVAGAVASLGGASLHHLRVGNPRGDLSPSFQEQPPLAACLQDHAATVSALHRDAEDVPGT